MGSQEEIFNEIQKSYPANTKFVVLPMDMKLMGAGPVRGDLDKQHMDLIAVSKKYPGQIVSFCTVDPRREDALERVKRYHELGCVGIKIYPNLGYLPTCPMLMDIYEYAQDHDMPIMAHCSPGGLLSSEMPREKAADLSHPRHYHSILKRYTNLRICLAHYGGNEEWQKYLMEDPSYQTNNPINQEETRNRLALISEMLHDYENLYTDISYTIFQFQQNISLLRVLLSDPVLQKKVLFGSDYYMIEREQMTEREVYFQLRATLGEELFRQIAEINPRLYLGGNWS
jgi:predicted TIM-barrel fold metal-dependent hydrolase